MKAAAADATLLRFPALWPGESRQEAAFAPRFMEELAADTTSAGIASVATDLMPAPAIVAPPMGLVMAELNQGRQTADDLPDFTGASMPFLAKPVFAASQAFTPLDPIADVTTSAPTVGSGPLDDPPLGRNFGMPDDGPHPSIPKPLMDGHQAAQVAALPATGRASTSQAQSNAATAVPDEPEMLDLLPRPVQDLLQPAAFSSSPAIFQPEQAAPMAPDPVGPESSHFPARGLPQASSASIAGLSDPRVFEAEPLAHGTSGPAMRADLLPEKQRPKSPPAAPSTALRAQDQETTVDLPTQSGARSPESDRRLSRDIALTPLPTGSVRQTDVFPCANDPDGASRQGPRALPATTLITSAAPEAPRAQALPETILPADDSCSTPKPHLIRFGRELGPEPVLPQGRTLGSSRPERQEVAGVPVEAKPGTTATNASPPSTYPGAQESALRLLWGMKPPAGSEGPLPSTRAARQEPVRHPPAETNVTSPAPGQNANPVQPAFPLQGQAGPEALSQTVPTSSGGKRAEPSDATLDHELGLWPKAPGALDSARAATIVKPDASPVQHVVAEPSGLERSQPDEPASMPLTRPDASEMSPDQASMFPIAGSPETDVARSGTLPVAPEPPLKAVTTGLSETARRPGTDAPARSQGDSTTSPMRQAGVALADLPPGQPGRIELTLAPETLGRLHFDMQPEGAGLSITLSAERPETLELMRRHIPELIAELKQAGVQAGTLSFGAWSDGRHASRSEKAEPDIGPAPGADLSAVPPAPLSRRAASSRGLDMRL